MSTLVAIGAPVRPSSVKRLLARRLCLGLLAFAGVQWVLALTGRPLGDGWIAFTLAFAPIFLGAAGHLVATYSNTPAGVRNDYNRTSATTARGLSAYLIAAALLGFYTLLYWFPAPLAGLIALVEPLSQALRARAADSWFLYGFLYSLAVGLMGVRMYYRYRHERYQLVRTTSVIFFQLGAAFLLPGLLVRMQAPEYYFTYFWPLKYEYLFPESFSYLMQSGGLGMFMIVWGAATALILTPVLTYFFGKRWYCSWVCGCGGLAETAGDPFRQLSSKSKTAWKIERWTIHIVLVLIVLGTALVWVNSATGGATLGSASQTFSKTYGFLVGAVLSGVVGVGFYPLLGSRVWCRFFCPLAALMGLIQRFFSRFRITTNGGQCISCGQCSTYCEMGIDVRSYAQRGENIVRSSCVGCGICAAVCPRGVLKLENGSTHADRFEGADKPMKELGKSLRS